MQLRSRHYPHRAFLLAKFNRQTISTEKKSLAMPFAATDSVRSSATSEVWLKASPGGRASRPSLLTGGQLRRDGPPLQSVPQHQPLGGPRGTTSGSRGGGSYCYLVRCVTSASRRSRTGAAKPSCPGRQHGHVPMVESEAACPKQGGRRGVALLLGRKGRPVG